MVSAFMGHLAHIGDGQLADAVRRAGPLRARPLGEDSDAAGDVLGYVPGVLAVRAWSCRLSRSAAESCLDTSGCVSPVGVCQRRRASLV
jgi:hypothetical protein